MRRSSGSRASTAEHERIDEVQGRTYALEMSRIERIEVDDGDVPVSVLDPQDPSVVPALLVIPSIFGPAPDLLERLAVLADNTLVAIPDPFWRTGEGALDYSDRDTAIGRLADFDPAASGREMATVAAWARQASNGFVVAVGICFGGPFVLGLAAEGLVNGVVTWHGSRMQNSLELVPRIACPVRHHIGGADPVVPPDALAAIRAGFAEHPDCEIVVHPGAGHGFSHDGNDWDESAYQAGLVDVVTLLDRHR